LDELTSVQLSEWEAYDRLDPIGKWRDDFRIASLTSVVTNIARTLYHDSKKGELVLTSPSDYMPKWNIDEEEEEEVLEDLPEGMFRSWTNQGWVIREKQTMEQQKRILTGIVKASKVKGKKRK